MAEFSVNSNMAALAAQNHMEATELRLASTYDRLATGLRIRRAADDAAGLAIAESLRADVQALNQAIRNASDALALLSLADAGLNQVQNLLQRGMTLAEQAASDVPAYDGSTSKAALDAEYTQILDEIDRIADSVRYNDFRMLQGAGITIDVQIGTSGASHDRITITTTGISASGLGLTSGALSGKSSARMELIEIQSAIDAVSSRRGELGASINRLSSIANLTTQEELEGARSQIQDANMAQEMVDLSKLQVLRRTGMAALAQANLQKRHILALLT